MTWACGATPRYDKGSGASCQALGSPAAGIAANLYYRWSKDFLETGKKQLAGDTVREATSDEVKDLRSENRELKEVVAEITLKNRVLKKSLTGHGEEDDT